jgi:hypothetical protein
MRPGAKLLDLVEERREDAMEPRLLRFSDGSIAVEVQVGQEEGQRQLTVNIPGQQDVTVALEQLAPSLRLVRTLAPPVRFEQVHGGFFSIVVTLPDPREPERCTAWTQV